MTNLTSVLFIALCFKGANLNRFLAALGYMEYI